MALLDVVESGQERVSDLRDQLDHAREALLRSDAVLAATDATLERAEVAFVAGRRWGKFIALGVGIAVVGAAAFVVIKRRRSSDDD